MGDLSRNFSIYEFRCSCGRDDCEVPEISMDLVESLQRLRDYFGYPIHIHSALRCPRKNRAVGGASRSQHLLGTAADIVVEGISPDVVAEAAEEIQSFRNGGIGRYDTFTHLDVRTNGPARWDYRKEKPNV